MVERAQADHQLGMKTVQHRWVCLTKSISGYVRVHGIHFTLCGVNSLQRHAVGSREGILIL